MQTGTCYNAKGCKLVGMGRGTVVHAIACEALVAANDARAQEVQKALQIAEAAKAVYK